MSKKLVKDVIFCIEYEPHNNYFMCGGKYLRPEDILEWYVVGERIVREFRYYEVLAPDNLIKDFVNNNAGARCSDDIDLTPSIISGYLHSIIKMIK